MALTGHCPRCAADRRFERPTCADCPEWACVECGTAILVVPETPLSRAA